MSKQESGTIKTVKRGGIAMPYQNGLFIITKDCWTMDNAIIPDELINMVVENQCFDWIESEII